MDTREQPGWLDEPAADDFFFRPGHRDRTARREIEQHLEQRRLVAELMSYELHSLELSASISGNAVTRFAGRLSQDSAS